MDVVGGSDVGSAESEMRTIRKIKFFVIGE